MIRKIILAFTEAFLIGLTLMTLLNIYKPHQEDWEYYLISAICIIYSFLKRMK